LTTCLNCGKSFEGKYCPYCGQKAGVERLTASVLLKETVHFFSHFEKGFLYTAWNFIVRPGSASINFLMGKRKQFQKPVSYFLILTGLYIIVHNFIIHRYNYHYSLSEKSEAILDFQEKSNILLRTHFTPFIVLIILFSAVIIYPILGRKKFNFIEILTLCLYGGGSYFLILILSDIVLGVWFKINVISIDVFIWQTSVSSMYNLWFSYDIFKRSHMHFFWLRLIVASLLVSLFGWLVMNYLPMLWIL
jgi:hypothetical protein